MAGDSPADDGIDRQWWKEAVVYEIYPRSFMDSDGDGIGDIPGIEQRVDYLDELGVDVVWLTPVYASPQVDNGYDISDYRAIDDDYGTMADWERLLEALHERDIRLVMDLVVNHTSDEHEWFVRSRQDEAPYDEYYHWVPGDPDERPNNWRSGFEGPAWSYDDEREAWYLHLFDEKQPDLQWDNPAVRQEVSEMITWWLENGIDGFRMDVFNLISKPPDYPDGDPDAEDWVGVEHFAHGPHLHEYLRELYDETFSNYDVMTVGEAIDASPERARQFCGESGDGLNMIFHYDHVTLDYGPEDGWWNPVDWDLEAFKAIFTEWQTELQDAEAWNTIFLTTHDWPRSVSRWGNDGQYRRESAKLLGTFLMTLQGTPYLVQGQELGMTNYPFESLEELRDADARNRIRVRMERGEIDSFEEVKDVVRYRARDNVRTPMQWSDADNAGFTDGEPWIGVNPNYESINVDAARADPDSVLQHYRALIDLRHSEDVLVYGDYDVLVPDHSQVFAYTRTLADERVLVVLNWSDDPCSIDLSADLGAAAKALLISNYDGVGTDLSALRLQPWDARVYRLQD